MIMTYIFTLADDILKVTIL